MEATRTKQVAGRVRRRMLAGAVVSHAGWGLVAGSAAGLGLVLATRMGWIAPASPETSGSVPWWGLLAASVSVGLLIGGGLGLLRRRTMLEAAQMADAVTGLRDRLSNAMSFSMRPDASASEQLAIADGERSTERVDVRRVAPVRFGTAWVVGPLIVASAVASGLWVPVRQQGPVTPVARRAPTDAQRAAAAETIARAAAEARETTPGPSGARATTEELERMEQIERELLDGTRSPAEALAEGSQQLESIADRVEREAAAESLADQATREAMADAIDAGEEDSALARALADGDLEAARDAAAELFDRIDQLSPEERERLAAELDRLAEQSARAPQDLTQNPAQGEPSGSESVPPASDPRLDELLREQGLDDMADIARSQDADAIRDRLEEEGIEPEAARRLADEIAEENQKRAAEESANEARDELSNAAREAADELREPPPPSPREGDPQEQGREGDAQQDRSESGDRPGGEASEQGERAQGDQQPGGEQSQNDGQPRQGEDGQSREGQQGQETDESQEGSEGQSQSQGESQDQSQGDATDQQQGQQEGQQQQGEQQQGEQQSQGEQQDDGQRQGEGEQRGEGDQTGQQGERQGEEQGPGEQTGQRSSESDGDPTGSEEGVQEQPGGEGNESEAPAGDGESGEQGRERMTDGQGEAPDPRGVERLRKQLERLAERGESAREKQRSAEKLREQAERMLDGASPEQREELEQLAREMARDNGGDGGGEPGGGAGTGPRRAEGAQPTPDGEWETEDVNARGGASGEPSDDGRVIAEWFGKDDQQPAGAGSAGPGSGAGSVVDEAAKGAERAVERRAVPRERRELIRRVFERYRQRAAERESQEKSDGAGGGS